MPKKPSTGYPKEKKKKVKTRSYLTNLIVPKDKKISIMEKIIKFLIYICLRIVVKPSRWKHPEKNYELIDRVYKKLMSSDLVFIPSSIAFYIIIAFMPILSLIIVFTLIPGIEPFYNIPSISNILGRFIPGIEPIINGFGEIVAQESSVEKIAGISGVIFLFIISIWIASGGMAKLVYTQSYLFEHKFVGGWWMNRLKGMAIVLSLTILLFLALLTNIQFEHLINDLNISQGGKEALTYLFLIFGLFILLFIGLVAFFKFSPRFKIKLRHTLPGAFVAALPTTLFLSFFALFASLLSYSTYGVIAILMYIGLVALWLSNFVFIGILTNSAYYKTHVSILTRQKWTVSKK